MNRVNLSAREAAEKSELHKDDGDWLMLKVMGSQPEWRELTEHPCFQLMHGKGHTYKHG